MSVDFDRHTEAYRDQVQRSIRFIGQDHDYFIRNKVGHLVDLTQRRLGDPKAMTVLDVGCGIGLTDRHLVSKFGRVYGVDISAQSIEVAGSNVPEATYRTYDGKRLPFDDESFQVTFTITVLHHVPPLAWTRFIEEMARVTSPDGVIVIFEHNPYNPLTRLAVFRCEFDDDVVLLSKRRTRRLFAEAGLMTVEDAYILVSPWRLWFADRVERFLARVPVGAQYFVAGAKPTL